ncbi:MAG: hypothetical protein K2Q09_09730, partial [Phycisphaerales bacterium]|nr:hypothetical protein [Phycisphaerales bacterium]
MSRTAVLAIALAALTTPGALAQFSDDPFAPEIVSDSPSDLSKIAMLSDGSFFVSWNQTGTGYDIYLQKYNAQGVEQWAHNGILIGDRTLAGVSGDYELRADANGNAYLAFPQDGNNTRLVKVDGAGAAVWSSIVSPDTASKIGARMALLSDGTIAVAWLEGAGFKVQRVSAAGAVIGTPLSVTETGKSLGLADLQAGDNGSFIVEWIRPTSFSRHVRAQKYDANNAPVWPDAAAGGVGMIIYQPAPGESWPLGGGTYTTVNQQGGSVQNGYFPYFKPDGQGGAVFCVYETAGPRSVYVQQVSAAGVKRWNTNYGLPVTSANTGVKISASADFDPATGDIYVAWTDTNTVQNQWGVSAQKIAADGTLAWGATGVTVSPLDANQEAFVYALRKQTPAGASGCYTVCFEGRAPAGISVAGAVEAAYVGPDGTLQWNPPVTELNSQTVSKGRLWAVGTPRGGAVMTYNNGGTQLALSHIADDATPPACAADLGIQGGSAGQDGQLDNNDFIAFITAFFANDPRADLGIQ